MAIQARVLLTPIHLATEALRPEVEPLRAALAQARWVLHQLHHAVRNRIKGAPCAFVVDDVDLDLMRADVEACAGAGNLDALQAGGTAIRTLWSTLANVEDLSGRGVTLH